MPKLQTEAMKALLAIAVASGARNLSLTSWSWDISGRCESAVTVPFTGRINPVRNGKGVPVELLVDARCRKCGACLRYRTMFWKQRAAYELRKSARTWFGTLTLKPELQDLFLMRAMRDCAHKGEDYRLLSEAAQFRARVTAVGPELGKYLKRVRKESGAKLRYLMVAESHKSGAPHFHVLMHEVYADTPVRKHTLDTQWRHLGFTQWRLVDTDNTRAAHYVCKYLAKSALARVRASARYGLEENVLNIAKRDSLTSPQTNILLTGGNGDNDGKCIPSE